MGMAPKIYQVGDTSSCDLLQKCFIITHAQIAVSCGDLHAIVTYVSDCKATAIFKIVDQANLLRVPRQAGQKNM